MIADTEYTANLHVHTRYSDGTGRIEEVIEAAGETLDILLINDHDTIQARRDGFEGYHGRLLVVIGFELSGPRNHYLVFGPDEVPEYDWNEPQAFIDRVREAGGIGFIAHPFEKGSPMSEGGRVFTWDQWDVSGFTGLEIWNHSSAWKTKARGWPSALFHYFFRIGPLIGPDAPTLAQWDEIGQHRPVVGVGGSDAHCKIFNKRRFTFRIFPYRFSFRSVNTHLLLEHPLSGDADRDKTAVLAALAGGSCFVAHDNLRRSDGFRFRLENEGRPRLGPGGETEYASGDRLAWRLPAKTFHRLLKDGQTAFQAKSDHGEWDVPGPGVYRLEVFHRSRSFGLRPWIFSNPIYLR